MTITSKYSLFAIMAGWLLPVSALYAGTASQDVKLTVIFHSGSCDIRAPSSVSFSNGAPVMRDSIAKNKESVSFNVTIANCSGYLLKPSIKVYGNIVNIEGTPHFMDTDSTAKGYGILLSTLGNTAWSANTNLAQDTRTILAKDWPQVGSDNITTLNGDLTFTAKLACGSCTVGPNLHGGNLKSTVTFTLKYN